MITSDSFKKKKDEDRIAESPAPYANNACGVMLPEGIEISLSPGIFVFRVKGGMTTEAKANTKKLYEDQLPKGSIVIVIDADDQFYKL